MPIAGKHLDLVVALTAIAVITTFLVPAFPTAYPPANNIRPCAGSVSVSALCPTDSTTMSGRGSLGYVVAGCGGVLLANGRYEMYVG